MQPNAAPIQQPIMEKTGLFTQVWIKWFDSIKRAYGNVPVYTVSTAPTGNAGDVAFISNESGGSVLAFYDGTNWRRCTDRNVIS